MTKASDQIRNIKGKLAIAQRVAKQKAIAELRKVIPQYIKDRTKVGEGIDGPLPDLAPSTIKRRAQSKLAPDTSPSESNLTMTGQLLNAIISEVIDDKLTFKINNKARKKTFRGDRQGKTNEQVRSYVEDKGFEFFGLTSKELDEFRNLAQKIIKEEFERILNA